MIDIEPIVVTDITSQDKNNTKAALLNHQNQIKKTEEQIKGLGNLIPSLMAIFNAPGSKAKITYYEGIEGLKKLYRDMLIPNSTLYSFIDIDKCLAALGDWIFEYANDRIKIGMDYFVIANHGLWEKNPKIDNKKQKRNIKFVNNAKFDTEIDIYSNKISVYSFRPPYAGVIIEDQAIHQTLKNIWKLLWENLK